MDGETADDHLAGLEDGVQGPLEEETRRPGPIRVRIVDGGPGDGGDALDVDILRAFDGGLLRLEDVEGGGAEDALSGVEHQLHEGDGRVLDLLLLVDGAADEGEWLLGVAIVADEDVQVLRLHRRL